jgi:hypothetical protein
MRALEVVVTIRRDNIIVMVEELNESLVLPKV